MGKSDLALRLIDRGATLIADDYTDVTAHGGHLFAKAPAPLAGMMEMRGVGLVPQGFVDDVAIVAAVNLVNNDAVERMPDDSVDTILGVDVPKYSLCAEQASTPIKVEYIVQAAQIGVPVSIGNE